MAFVDWSQFEEVDYSRPYKTFIDLVDDDKIFLIDFKNLTIKPLSVKNISTKPNNNYKILNRFEVSLQIPEVAHIIISDGNRYLDKVFINYHEEYITTDKRIAEIVIDLLRSRNSYQWNCLTGIFGNPMNKYTEKEIKLC